MSDITEAAKKNMTGLKTQALNHCAGRLDKDDLKKLGDIIDEYAGILDFELEQLVEDKGAAGGIVAMDRAPRSFGSVRTAVQEIQAIDAAMRECAPHLGGRVIAYDSAGAVYKEALISMGYKDRLKGITTNGNGFQGIYRLAVQPGGPGPSRLAMDSATSDFNSRFPTAAKIVGGTGRV